jgi:hypothetical protein
MTVRNIGASIRDRLLNKARAEKLDYNLLLTRYALERILYRLSISGTNKKILMLGFGFLQYAAAEGTGLARVRPDRRIQHSACRPAQQCHE